MHPTQLFNLCAELTQHVLRLDKPADGIISSFFKDERSLGVRERATLAQTVFRILRHKSRFEWLIATVPNHPAPPQKASKLPNGKWQKTHPRVLSTKPHNRLMAVLGFSAEITFAQAAITEAEWTWRSQALSFWAKEAKTAPDAVQLDMPDWLHQLLVLELGDELPELAAALQQNAGLDLRVNTQKTKRETLQAALAAQEHGARATAFSPWGLRVANKASLAQTPEFKNGDFEVQDEGSQLLALLVDAKRGEMVADFCAGAGGKTLALGAAMRSSGRLYAFDTAAHRLDALKPRLVRSGLSNVYTVAIAHENDERIKRLHGKLDRVLVDAPCSGLGTLRRNPDMKWRQTAQVVADMVPQQTAILQAAAKLLKPGGRLVYATCSLLKAENEDIAHAFSQSALGAEFEPVACAALLGDLKIHKAPTLCSADGQFLRLYPHRHGTDGFFAAVWQRKD